MTKKEKEESKNSQEVFALLKKHKVDTEGLTIQWLGEEKKEYIDITTKLYWFPDLGSYTGSYPAGWDDPYCGWSFKIHELPGCCGVVVWNCVFCNAPVTKGLMELAKYIAKKHGYTVLIATDHTEGRIVPVVEKDGWEECLDFHNNNTGNLVKMYKIQLISEEEVLAKFDNE
jgi:hypothetical protein